MMESTNIHDGVHFLNGKDKYLFSTYVGRVGDFDVTQDLIYPSNEWILNLFNEKGAYGSGEEIKSQIAKIKDNPKDWIMIKHCVYRKHKIWLYGQIALYSPILGLKCYRYKYMADAEPPDYSDMDEFEEIPAKEFKFQSAIRPYL